MMTTKFDVDIYARGASADFRLWLVQHDPYWQAVVWARTEDEAKRLTIEFRQGYTSDMVTAEVIPMDETPGIILEAHECI